MYQQIAVQNFTPWQKVRRMSCFVMCLSIIVVVYTTISLILIKSIIDTDSILITDKIECERFFNGVSGRVCKNDIDCWLCATKTPQYVKRDDLLPPIVSIITGISICIYMMAYACNCDLLNFLNK